eukprot:1072086-Amphidinium_carterae.2
MSRRPAPLPLTTNHGAVALSHHIDPYLSSARVRFIIAQLKASSWQSGVLTGDALMEAAVEDGCCVTGCSIMMQSRQGRGKIAAQDEHSAVSDIQKLPEPFQLLYNAAGSALLWKT